MARSVRDARLDTREARSRLKVQGKPHWRLIEPGLHLGYRRLRGKPGTWCLRRYVGAQIYKVEALKGVVADDYADADGRTVLSFGQAQQEVQKRKPQAGPVTVREVVERYLRDLEDRTGVYDAGSRARSIIFPQLGDDKVAALTTERLRKWLADLAKTPVRKRTSRGERQQYCVLDTSDEGRRRRRASANRTLTVLKAALNKGWHDGDVASDEVWRRVKPFKSVARARARYLTVEECQRLINAADGEFRLLVQAALFTGCRYSELARLTAGDFNASAGTVHIGKSKSGRPPDVYLTDEGAGFFRSLAIGRGSAELLFRMPAGMPWRDLRQRGPMQIACERARIKPAAGFHALRHTWASLAIMAGMPLVVAARNLGHASTKMVEAHYGHLAPNYVADAVRQHAPQFGIKSDRKVAALGRV